MLNISFLFVSFFLIAPSTDDSFEGLVTFLTSDRYVISICGHELPGISLQDEILNNISTAIAAGSSKELIKYCGDNVEIKINGKSSTYSLPQAEVVLKDFFHANPARGFRYVHQGSSPEGLKYSIGTLDIDGGSYRVVMVIKNLKGALKIDQINFSKE